MSENYQIAVQLLIVGMISVFVILGIVTSIAKLLILAINNYFPEPTDSAIPKVKSLDSRKLAVISATIELVTQGKGRIESIKKI